MLVHVTRTAVCMGDDVFDNSRDIGFDDNAAVCDVISTLNADSFFPYITGNDVMWAVLNSRGEVMLEYYTKNLGRTVYMVPKNALLREICGSEMTLHCVYYSNYRKG